MNIRKRAKFVNVYLVPASAGIVLRMKAHGLLMASLLQMNLQQR